MKYLIAIFAIATCADAIPMKLNDKRGNRAIYNHNHFPSRTASEYNLFPSKTTPEYNFFSSKTTPEYNLLSSKTTLKYNHFPSKTTPEHNLFSSKTTPEVTNTPLETTTPANYSISSNRGELISPDSSESFKSIMALVDILKQVFEFVSSENFSRLFSGEGIRSVSYVLFELAPLVLGPYGGIIRVLLSPVLRDTANSMFETEY